MTERTFAIIKPDAVERRVAGKIIQRIEDEGFQIRAMKRVRLSTSEAEGSTRCIAARVFRKPDHVHVVRAGHCPGAGGAGRDQEMAHADGCHRPAKADTGTIRKEFGQSIERNATHGSDAPETAVYEIGYFFAGVELV
jgi:nucleoside-diphosphate kinase